MDHINLDPVDYISLDPVDHISLDPVDHISLDPVDHISIFFFFLSFFLGCLLKNDVLALFICDDKHKITV